MPGRGELTDRAWGRIAPLLPANGRRGKQWRDHRAVVNGILWKLRTGAPWRDLPERYGPWRTCYDRFVRWRRDERSPMATSAPRYATITTTSSTRIG